MKRSVRTLATALVPMLALGPQRAHAMVESNLVYEVDPGCPAQQDFVAAVESRGASFSAIAPEEQGRTFAINIRRDGAGFVGSIQVKRGNTASAAREVHGPTCSEVVEALSVVTVIELQPMQKLAPKGSTTEAGASSPIEGADESQSTQTKGRSFWGDEVVKVGAGDVQFRSARAFSLSIGAAYGPFPKLMFPRYDFVFQRANLVLLPGGQARMNGPILRVRATSFGPPESVYRANNADAEYQAGIGFGLDICWTPYYHTDALMFLACSDIGIAQWGSTPISSTGAKGKATAMGVGTAGILLELDHKLGSIFMVGGKFGAELVAGSFTAHHPDGSEISLTPASIYGSLVLGLHFF